VGVDLRPGPAVDVVHDLNQFPWPLPDSTYERVLCIDVLEHLQDVLRVLEEIHRVSTPGAIVEIQVPTATSWYAYTDPTHIRGFGWHSFDYVVPTTALAQRYGYVSAPFALMRRRFAKQPQGWLGPLDRLMCRLANAIPQFYEQRLAYLYPMDGLHVRLRVIK